MATVLWEGAAMARHAFWLCMLLLSMAPFSSFADGGAAGSGDTGQGAMTEIPLATDAFGGPSQCPAADDEKDPRPDVADRPQS